MNGSYFFPFFVYETPLCAFSYRFSQAKMKINTTAVKAKLRQSPGTESVSLFHKPIVNFQWNNVPIYVLVIIICVKLAITRRWTKFVRRKHLWIEPQIVGPTKMARIHRKYTEYRKSKTMDNNAIFFAMIKLLFTYPIFSVSFSRNFRQRQI